MRAPGGAILILRMRKRTLAPVASLFLTFLWTACGGHAAPAPGTIDVGSAEEGIASWYGRPFHGRATASGEIYDMEAMTAAHRSLPLGARVRVENLDNGRTAEFRINDRGPFVDDRIIDLSRAGARALDMVRAGTARVRVVITRLPDCFQLQVGSFARDEMATALRSRLSRSGERVALEPGPDGHTRVVTGPYESADQAREARDRHGGIVRPCDGSRRVSRHRNPPGSGTPARLGGS